MLSLFAASLPLVVAVMQDPVTFKYDGKRGQSNKVDLRSKFGIGFEGEEASIDLVRGLSPLLSLEKAVFEGPATVEVTRAPRAAPLEIRVAFDSAKVSGSYDEEEYEYSFDKAKAADGLEQDKLKAMLYTIFSAGGSYRLAKNGVVTDQDPNQDPAGEALSLILRPTPRFPDRALKVGETWELEWESRTQEKDHKGRIKFKQTATFESLDGPRAVIVWKLEGKDNRDGKDSNGNVNEVKVKGEAKVTFDLEQGRVAAYEASGEIRTVAKGEDPNSGTAFDLSIILKGESKMTPRPD